LVVGQIENPEAVMMVFLIARKPGRTKIRGILRSLAKRKAFKS
jgi:hypothetical protein